MTTEKTPKCLIATYECDLKFRIPDEVDMDARNVDYYVRWKTLYIRINGEVKYEIEAVSEHLDFKRPDKMNVEDDEEEYDDEVETK